VSLGGRLKIASGARLATLFTGFVGAQGMGHEGSIPMLASMGASAAILFAVPQSPMARG
jgi:CBS-domain-containing membrane protein